MNASPPAAWSQPSRLRWRLPRGSGELVGQGIRFAAVGGGATLVQLAVYAFLGDCLGAQLANVASWLIATLVAGVAHHRFTFRLDHSGSERDHLVNLSSSLASLLLCSAVLAVAGNPAGAVGILLLLAINGAVGSGRFVLLRWWLVGRKVLTGAVRPAGQHDAVRPAPDARPLSVTERAGSPATG